ncbi:MaoC/PaaZ C-terminal domain-containing protein [Ferroacidibacillus organovorans]|uniref:Dehydratase n=1 Tax=Ferroacidibacillus organovorans TaxID=1765683 RepID=A0A101XNT1_9BACL|nr:MaoC/PaaZ C-terminal domain-containing protein [Ferroacidibacillus organovorans]KUO94704.1 dehydratase [Ferroacidibacillus organovorans]
MTFSFMLGEELPTLTKPPVSRTQLVQYSGASGDFNPIHTVDEAAVASGLPGVIAHGMLTMAFVGQMLTDMLGDLGALREWKVRFRDMVFPGDVVTCGGRVRERAEEGTITRVVCDVFARTHDERVVIAGEAILTIAAQGDS